MLVVAKSHTHVGLLTPSWLTATPAEKCRFGKMSVAVVAVKIISSGIVGNEEIEMSIVVKIGPNRSHPKRIRRIIHPGLLRHIRKRAVAIVVVEVGRRSLQTARTALHIDSVVLARRPGTEGGKIVQIKIHIVRHKQVRPAIAVVVAKSRAGSPS